MFRKTTHDDLSAKIRKLDSKVAASQSFFGSFQPHQWNDVFELIKEIRVNSDREGWTAAFRPSAPQIVQPLPANSRVVDPVDRGPINEQEIRTERLAQPDASRPRF